MSFLVAVLVFFILFFGFFCIKFAIALIRVQEAIEDALDEIDSKYNSISSILQIPVFFDSPEVKRIVSEIYDVRESIIYVADILSNSVSKKNKKESKDEREEDLES